MDALDELLDGAPPRVAVVGNAGAGKSTLARALAARLGAEVLDLDGVYWEPRRVAERRDVARAHADVAAFCDARERWVVEGCYGELIEPLVARGPLLVWLDPGTEACLRHCRARPWEPAKFASKAEQDAHLGALLAWVAEYDARAGELSRGAHGALFEAWTGPKRRLEREPEGVVA